MATTPYDKFAFTSYETFLLSQYHIDCTGLYYTYNGSYVIHCPNVTETTPSLEGDNLHRWFDTHKMMGTNIRIVRELPEHAVKIDDHVPKAKSAGAGYLISRGDVEYEINLLIPAIFPDYEIRWSNPISIAFKEEVTETGFMELQDLFQKNNFPLKVQFINDPLAKSSTGSAQGVFSYIMPSRFAKHKLGTLLAAKWEQDEDDWMNNRDKVLLDTSKAAGREAYFNSNKFRCIIDCNIGIPSNIRNYLSLYEEVCISLPTGNTEAVFKGLDVSPGELRELVAMNKVQILAPHSIERYELPLMESLVEANDANVHLTRRLSSLILKENGRRNPLFLPSISLEERKLLLQSCDEASRSLDNAGHRRIQTLLSGLGNWWVRMPNAVNQLPSGALSAFGISDMVNTMLVGDASGRANPSFALNIASSSVELTAALGATFVPVINELLPVYQMMADLYSGVPDENWMIQEPAYANFAVENLLVVADKVPVTEFAQTFTGAEVNRFRETVLAISQNVKGPEELEENIAAYNHFVKLYERDSKKLNLMNIGGFVLGQAAKAKGIPFASWLIKQLQKYVLKKARNNAALGAIIDHIEANIAGNYPAAVLISGMKTKLKDKI